MKIIERNFIKTLKLYTNIHKLSNNKRWDDRNIDSMSLFEEFIMNINVIQRKFQILFNECAEIYL